MVLFLMLNPSIANEAIDDLTQVRCRCFAISWGYGGYYVGNLFAHVSTDPKASEGVEEPVGPENDSHIKAMLSNSALTIAAWGCGDERRRERAEEVARLLSQTRLVYCLARTKDDCPRHPLYLKKDAPFTEWKGRT